MSKANSCYVYIYFHPKSGEPIYVGKGTGNRWLFHRYRSNNVRLSRSMAKYGPNNHPVVKIREGLTELQAFNLEILLIKVIGRSDQ